ncbi:hypothetical protein DSO57_1031269 [Entomophthora muscae]|uniref:Uncharacterized protein n=1 Tax=Entomophthora muscae TaxID=34485 RepID=A0ACC2UKJ4_9FUNG|nr:hypothetical protein DSO57_1031269 [Entomophthora muscae]
MSSWRIWVCVVLVTLFVSLPIIGTIWVYRDPWKEPTSPPYHKSPLDTYMSPLDLSILPPARPSLKLCQVKIINHTFANSHGSPLQSNYIPPHDCIGGGKISRAVLNYQNQANASQSYHFGAIYLDKSEILRTTTAEPIREGITWEFEKDISHITPLLYNQRTVTHILTNTVDPTYTGKFHVVASIDLYISPQIPNAKHKIVSISRDDKEPWYEINSALPLSHKFNVPKQSVKRAELEVFLSGHSCDEFTYLNTPTEHAKANGECEMGPYRELEVYLDDHFVGSIMPYPVIYTSGLSNVQWRPISAMGSFDVPTKVIDLAPYLSLLEDGTHAFTFHMKNATNMWFISANLHLYETRKPPKKMIGEPTQRNNTSTSIVEESKDFFKTAVVYETSVMSIQSFGDTLILTRLDNSVDFSHSISYSQSKVFDLDCTSTTKISTFLLNHPPNTIDTLWDTTQQPLTTQVRSETYRLSGTYFLSSTLRKLNISLHSVTATYGITGGISKRGDTRTELKLIGNSHVDTSMVTYPSLADNTIQAAVRHQQKTASHETCYSRNLAGVNGEFTQDETTKSCPLPKIEWLRLNSSEPSSLTIIPLYIKSQYPI